MNDFLSFLYNLVPGSVQGSMPPIEKQNSTETQYNIPSLLDAGVSPSLAEEIARKLQVSAMVEDMKNRGTDVTYGNARIGYPFELANGLLSLGITGNGSAYKSKTPEKTYKGKDIGLRGIDFSYEKGPNAFGAAYSNYPVMGNSLNFFYERKF